jgi:hypothetical protein
VEAGLRGLAPLLDFKLRIVERLLASGGVKEEAPA